ncbi:hypothetical protein, partial [Pyramidobacter piscolens]|uniref:hypothetical protein n=1 Tax=Pyramidobacter piscolens TaxID=638849 RepID=UPI0033172C93
GGKINFLPVFFVVGAIIDTEFQWCCFIEIQYQRQFLAMGILDCDIIVVSSRPGGTTWKKRSSWDFLP